MTKEPLEPTSSLVPLRKVAWFGLALSIIALLLDKTFYSETLSYPVHILISEVVGRLAAGPLIFVMVGVLINFFRKRRQIKTGTDG